MHHEDASPPLNELVARAVHGEQQAVEDLIAEIRPMVVRYCRARLGRTGGGAYTTADDVTQEVCVAVMNALPRYQNQGRPFSAFVFGIAAHKVTDAHRRAAREMSQPTETVPDTPDSQATPEAAAMAAATARQVRALLDTLPTNHREVLVMRIVMGMSAEETGHALGMSPGAVRVAQHRALGKLRQRALATAEAAA